MSIAIIFVALAMVMTMGTAFARYGPPGGSGGGGGRGSGTHAPVSMYPVYPPTSDSSATIGWTISKGFGSSTLRITANLPVPSTCTVPYSVRLTGTTLTDPTTTPIDITEYLTRPSVGKDNPRVMLPAGEAGAPTCDEATNTWYAPDGTVISAGTLMEWAYNQDFGKGFEGTAEVFNNTSSVVYFAYPKPGTGETIKLPVRVNPNKGEGE